MEHQAIEHQGFLHDPAFWIAVAFVVLIVAIYKPVKQALLSMIDARILRIQSELNRAIQLREEAQTILASIQRKQAEALEEAERILKRAQQEAKDMLENASNDLEQALAKRNQIAIQKIEAAETTLLQEVRSEAVDKALILVNDLVKQHIDKQLADSLVGHSVAAISAKLH